MVCKTQSRTCGIPVELFIPFSGTNIPVGIELCTYRRFLLFSRFKVEDNRSVKATSYANICLRIPCGCLVQKGLMATPLCQLSFIYHFPLAFRIKIQSINYFSSLFILLNKTLYVGRNYEIASEISFSIKEYSLNLWINLFYKYLLQK
jgi:hypothetical protein